MKTIFVTNREAKLLRQLLRQTQPTNNNLKLAKKIAVQTR
jgi:hypothetical protein